MAKKQYIGVSDLAHKIKKGYWGVETNIPIYEEKIGTVSITASNLSEYFGVANESYYFAGSGSTFTSNNKGQNSSSAVSTWTAKQDMSAVSFSYSVSSEASYDKLMIVVKGTTVANSISGTVSSTWSGSLSKGDTIYLSYSKDVSQAGGNDCGTLSNMSITTTVKTQVGTETISLARKIKKAYIGIGNIARPFWGPGTLKYHGTATNLSEVRSGLVATTVGNYALFGGGMYRSGYKAYASSIVDSYNTSLTKGTATSLAGLGGGEGGSATTIGNYALFVNGYYISAYNTSLVQSTPTAPSDSGSGKAATSVGNYAIFAGGVSGSGYATYYHPQADAYDTSLIHTVPTELSGGRVNFAATPVGNYALFGGGGSIVDAYDTSLTRSTPTELSSSRSNLAATSINNNYALFGGGSSVVDAYNTSLTRIIPTPLSESRSELSATSIGDYALFGGGGNYSSVVDAYDASLTRSIPTGLSVGRNDLAATSVGEYALFGGGIDTSTYQVATVDVYTLV